ncbi:MAG: hypothetical protein KBS61_04885, partial [Chryseobacterium sp.]|nr:hypothetical protein [Candidatus Chryseobacterium enterohippi]
VRAHNENFIVLDKDQYTITTDVCDVKYSTQKTIKNNVQLSINNPVYKTENDEEKSKDKEVAKVTTKKKIISKGKSGNSKKKK